MKGFGEEQKERGKEERKEVKLKGGKGRIEVRKGKRDEAAGRMIQERKEEMNKKIRKEGD